MDALHLDDDAEYGTYSIEEGSCVAKLINSEVTRVEPSGRTIFVHVSFRVVLVCASYLCITLAVFTGFLRGATALLVAALQPVATRWTRSFQLTYMSREDHAQSLIAMSSQQIMASNSKTRAYYSANNCTVSFGM